MIFLYFLSKLSFQLPKEAPRLCSCLLLESLGFPGVSAIYHFLAKNFFGHSIFGPSVYSPGNMCKNSLPYLELQIIVWFTL